MCTQKNDARRSASRIDLIISQFERRRAPSSTGAVLREILEPHSADAAENFSSTKSYRAIDNSVSVSESDSYSNSESDSEVSGGTEQWKSIAGWKLPISKSELISEVVVRVAVEYWQCAGRHLLSNIPPVTLENLAAVAVVTSASVPRMVTNLVIYPSCRLVFGTLYPAYASYKAVRTKNVKEYVKWMMYWIVFALFTCAETVTDVFFSWFPFYYEVKILLVLWLLSPATKGSSILYRKFVHPALCRREQEIDEYISKAKDQGYHTVLNLGTKGVNYATNVIMQTAIKGGGGLVQQIRRSYSLSDLSVADETDCRNQQELDEASDVVLADPRLVRRSTGGHGRGRSPRPQSTPRMDMIFPEMDISGHNRNSRDIKLSQIRSSEDVSSDTSSGQDKLVRTASIGGSTSRTRSKVTRSTFTSIKRPGAAEDSEVLIEEMDDDGEPSSFFNNLPFPRVDGTVCLPYSKDIISQYLRFIMDSEIHGRVDSNKSVDDYQQYLKLKELFDSDNSHIIEKPRIVTSTEAHHLKEVEKPLVISHCDNVSISPCLHESLDPGIAESPSGKISESTKNNDIDVEISNIQSPLNDKKLPKSTDSENTYIEENSSKPVDSLKPYSIFDKTGKINEESRSIGASSSNMSSEDESGDAEFTTPNSSPVMKNKIVRHKKRHAPPPPTCHSSSPSEKNYTDNIEVKMDSKCDQVESLDAKIPEDKDQSLGGISVKRSDSALSHTPVKRKQRTKSRSSSKGKNESSLSKLMHLPSKLAFWNTPEDGAKLSTSDNESYESIYENSSLSDNGSALNIKHSKEVEKTGVDSQNPTLDLPKETLDKDMISTEQIKSEVPVVGVVSSCNDTRKTEIGQTHIEPLISERLIDNNNYTYIPLRIDTLVMNTESKSTDV